MLAMTLPNSRLFYSRHCLLDQQAMFKTVADPAMNHAWSWVQETFNNREIATGIWILVAFTSCLLLRGVRKGIWDIIKACFQTKLLILFGSLSLNVAGLCWLFSRLELWTWEQCAPTVLWYFLSGLALTGRAISAKEDERHFRNLTLDCFRITVIFEFVIVAHSFSLLVELMLVPFMTFVGLMIAFSETTTNSTSVKKFFDWVALAIVLLMLGKSIGSIWDDPEVFFTTQTGRNFLLPGLLTLGSVPFFYFWYCYSHAEGSLVRINFKTFQSDSLKRYARRRFFRAFIVRPWLLQRAIRQFHVRPAMTPGDVDEIVSEISAYERERKNPPGVDENLGWSPYLACNFLQEEGLETEDYHSGHGGREWWAASKHIDLDTQVLPGRAVLYIEGTRGLVTTLRLKGDFRDDSTPTVALQRFNHIAQTLVGKSIPGEVEEVRRAIKCDGDFALVLGNTQVVRTTDPYPDGQGFELSFILDRGVSRGNKG